jgi:hypothetical protein
VWNRLNEGWINEVNDVMARIGSPTGCTIAFATPYNPAPQCVVSWQTKPGTVQYSVTGTALILAQTAASSSKVNYACYGT